MYWKERLLTGLLNQQYSTSNVLLKNVKKPPFLKRTILGKDGLHTSDVKTVQLFFTVQNILSKNIYQQNNLSIAFIISLRRENEASRWSGNTKAGWRIRYLMDFFAVSYTQLHPMAQNHLEESDEERMNTNADNDKDSENDEFSTYFDQQVEIPENDIVSLSYY